MKHTPTAVGLMLATTAASCVALVDGAPHARADAVADLLNTTLRAGYNFANADEALADGRGICDKFGQGRSFVDIMGDVKTDFKTGDEYQASYLISQAANELCPELI